MVGRVDAEDRVKHLIGKRQNRIGIGLQERDAVAETVCCGPLDGRRAAVLVDVDAGDTSARQLRQEDGGATSYPALILPQGAVEAFLSPPSDPSECTFARVSVNYSADLHARIEPCFFGGDPDCSQCGCAVSAGLHWLRVQPLAFGLRAGHLIDWSLAYGNHAPRRTIRA